MFQKTKSLKIPQATINRLSLYCRQLELLEKKGEIIVSSEKLAYLCEVNSAQVRKDLGYFGEFGIRGVGYHINELKREIKRILAIDREYNMTLAGVGNLGSALLRYQNFHERGFHFVCAFDSDQKKIGEVISGVEIRDIKELPIVVQEKEVKIGVIATPPSSAQNVANLFLDAKVNAILNFSPVHIHVPECCLVENIDFTLKLDVMLYKNRNQIAQGI